MKSFRGKFAITPRVLKTVLIHCVVWVRICIGRPAVKLHVISTLVPVFCTRARGWRVLSWPWGSLADLKRATKFYWHHAILFTINTGMAPNTNLSLLTYFVFLRLGLRDDDTVYKQVISNQIIFIGLRSSKDDQVGWWGYVERVIWVWVFYVSRYVGGGGLDGIFGEQGLPVGIQECLKGFHRGCVNYR